jgi:predicted RNase H-like nuclease
MDTVGMDTVLGVDACRAGWVGIAWSSAGVRPYLARTIAELAEQVGEVAVMAIDMPIGLPDAGRRQADVLARDLIRPRQSSVFMTPVRAALHEPSHGRANAVQRVHAGEGMSIQAFGLLPKIREVDEWLPTARCRVVEAHPEVSFAQLAGEPLTVSKKTWAGAELRRNLLADVGITLTGTLGAAGLAAVDDILDAAAVAWTARRVHLGTAISVPDPPERFYGIAAAIWR